MPTIATRTKVSFFSCGEPMHECYQMKCNIATGPFLYLNLSHIVHLDLYHTHHER